MQFRKHYLLPAQELVNYVIAELELNAHNCNLEREQMIPVSKGLFDYKIITSDWPATPGLQQVQVIVTWSDRGKPGSLSLTTLLPVTEADEHPRQETSGPEKVTTSGYP